MTQILIIDDESLFREDLAAILSGHGFETTTAATASEAEKLALKINPDIILCDLVLPDINDCELIEKLKIVCPDALLVVMTAFGTIDTVIDAFRVGASDFILKPIVTELLLAQLKRFVEYRNALLNLRRLRTELAQTSSPVENFNKGLKMSRVLKLMKKVCETDSTVLLTGENGTGKEIISRGIHDLSSRRDLPFIAINCSAIPENLFESELFGHLRGSFTGAEKNKEGLLEVANNGTLFLDEIAELPIAIQSKLLRVLEEREFTRVGSTKPIKLKARIIAATNRDLEENIKTGSFREDLFYRLNVFPIDVPPLRERADELPYLCNHFISIFNQELNIKCLGIQPVALQQLIKHSWPGNVRELKNVLERSMILLETNLIELSDLPEYICALDQSEKQNELLKDAVVAFEKMQILQVYIASNKKKDETARRLGINPSTLYRKSVEYDLGI